jgi:PAS domain S-box-containing protein
MRLTARRICGHWWFSTAVLLALMIVVDSPRASPELLESTLAQRPTRVGGDHDYPPFEWLDASGRPRGFNIDLMAAIAEVMGLRMEFQLGPLETVRDDLQAGRIDVMPMVVSPKRLALFDFSEPHTIVYYETYGRSSSAPIQNLGALTGRRIIVQRGSLIHEYLRDLPMDIELVLVESEPDALRLLASGLHDYALVSQLGGWGAVKRYRLSNLATMGPPLLPRGYGLAVNKGDSELLDQLNRGLSILKATGRYSQIHDRWFGELFGNRLSFMMMVSYATWALVPLVAIAVGALIWTGSLKRQVAQHTRALQHELNERRQAEQALRESKDRLRDITEAASDWIWEMNADLQFTHLSERFFELTRIAPGQVLGRTRWEVAGVATGSGKWRQHRETLESHAAFRDFVYKTGITDGRSVDRYFNISGKPIFDQQGNFKGYRGTGTDITDKIQVELALSESQRALATLMDNLPGMAYRCRGDHYGEPDFVSSGCRNLMGYRPEQLIKDRSVLMRKVIHPGDRKKVHYSVKTALRNRTPFQCTYRIQTASGEQKWVWEQGRGVFDDAGELQAIEGFVMDITARKRAETEKARMRLYLRNIIDSMPSVLVGVDTEGRVTEWNQAADRLSDISWSDAQGRFFGDVFPQLRDQWEQVRLAIRHGRPRKTQRLTTEIEGNIRFHDVMIYPLSADGTVGAVIRLDDVTARVRIEEMMVQTEKMLSIGGLAAGMAHEINNPLGTVLQATQNILRRISPGLDKNQRLAEELGLDLGLLQRYLEQREILHFLGSIHEAGVRAGKIVSDMLSFSRRSELSFSYTDIDDLLETVVRLAGSDYDLKKRYDFRQITIRKDYDPSLTQIKCDKTEIEQVVLNLVKNAAQAMSSAGTQHPIITLRTRREPNYACIEVQDNGPGMEERIRKRVFEPFFTTKEVGFGTGLGLSVSYFIVTEQHRGTLSVTSKPNEGTRFSMRLPLERGDVAGGIAQYG